MDKRTREEVLKLMKDKDKLEIEIKELFAVLAKNGVGLNEPLVDPEGFPLSNVDIYQVRHARHLLICKQNDHKAIMKQIELGLQEYYAGANNDGVRLLENKEVGFVSGPCLVPISHKIPIAKINAVLPGSPADLANLQSNDLIVQFGSVNSQNYRNLSDIGTVVFHSEGMQIDVKVKRGDVYIKVCLVPHKWAGNGLLGCNVVPLE